MAITQTTLRPSSLGALRERLRARWSLLSDAEIDRANGSLEKLTDTIHAATGEPRAAIKRELRRLLIG